ncbi:MAG: hypothetical protein P8X74_22830 [Reinekea sp.]
MLPKNWGEPMGAPAIFEKQIEIKLLHPASTEGVTDSGISVSAIVSGVWASLLLDYFPVAAARG